MENITFTQAVVSDADGIRYVQRETWLATYPNPSLGITREDIEAKIDEMNVGGIERLQKKISEGGNTRIWVAKDTEKVVGFIRIDKSDEKNSLRSLYVLPDYQGKGIGKKLMELTLGWVDKNKKVVLEVAAYNDKAINFYKSFGFIENGPTLNEAGKLPSGNIIAEIEMVKESTS